MKLTNRKTENMMERLSNKKCSYLNGEKIDVVQEKKEGNCRHREKCIRQ